MKYWSTIPDWRGPGGSRSADVDWWAPMGIEGRLLLRTSTTGGGGGAGVWSSPTMCNLNLMSAIASAEMQSVIMEGQNLPRYSSWENISVTSFPVAYSGSAQWIAAATSGNVCGVEGYRTAMWSVVAPSYWWWRKIGGRLSQALPSAWTKTSCHRWPLRDKHRQTRAP